MQLTGEVPLIRSDEEREAERLKIYALLVEETPQSVIVDKTGIEKSRVSRITAELLKNEFLEVKVHGKPILYRKGKNGNILDKALLQRQVAVNSSGVTKVAPIRPPNVTRVHHLKYRLNVIRKGDVESFKQTVNGNEITRPLFTHARKPYRGTQRYDGKVPYNDTFVTVELEESSNRTSIYICPPAMDMTSDEIREGKHKQQAVKVCTDIAAFLQSNAGWQFGLPEETDWKVHYGCDTPQVMKGLTDRITMHSTDHKAMLSDSEGRHEMEFTDSTQAAVWLELPGEVIRLKGSIREIAEGIREINDVLQEVKTALESTTQINAITTEVMARDAIQKVKLRKADAKNEVEATTASLPYEGVAYQ